MKVVTRCRGEEPIIEGARRLLKSLNEQNVNYLLQIIEEEKRERSKKWSSPPQDGRVFWRRRITMNCFSRSSLFLSSCYRKESGANRMLTKAHRPRPAFEF
ncbi:MAG: hypothetical protein HYW02_02010 [Deltaproteobacteria bacterium]|nr:hypothetical protein [Deltaproteobacteria bacterium]